MEILLARVLIARQEYGEAVALLRRSLASLEEAVGTTDPHLVPGLHLLGRCLWRTGEHGDAQLTLQRAGNITALMFAGEVEPGLELRPSTGIELEFYRGDLAGAAEALRNLLAFEAQHGVTPDPDEQPAWETLGEVEEAAGHADAAREAYAKALAAWERVLTPGHPRTDWARSRLALLEGRRAA